MQAARTSSGLLVFLAPRALAQGTGYAIEAAGAVLKWMEERFDAFCVVCLIQTSSALSLRVAEKLGFVGRSECVYRGYPAVRLERQQQLAKPWIKRSE